MNTIRHCPEWSIKDNYQPKPMEKIILKCCGTCKYYCQFHLSDCCINPKYLTAPKYLTCSCKQQ